MLTRAAYAPAHSQARRGISTPVLLAAVAIAMLLAIAALQLAQLSHQRQELQAGASAAALAAAAYVHDERWLYIGVEDAAPDTDDFATVQTLQFTTTRAQAIAFAALNSVADKEIELDDNVPNDLDGDIVIGFVADPVDAGFVDVQDSLGVPGPDGVPDADVDGGYNSVLVRASRQKAADGDTLLWMAEQLGLDDLENLEMVISAQALVDQRVYGFRPLAQVNVPILPIAVIPNDPEPTFAGDFPAPPIYLWWANGPQDEYTVDPVTQTVSDPSDGDGVDPDGIAEIVIRIDPAVSGTPEYTLTKRRGALVGFGSPADASPAAIAAYSLNGLDTAALLPSGEMSVADENNPPILPAEYTVTTVNVGDYVSALTPLIGVPRLFPLGEVDTTSSIAIIGFVAGTIVDCRQDPNDDSLLIFVQPCLLQTPTALTRGANLRNPWIGKLLLNR